MASVHDMQAARQTYDGFIRLIKFSTPVVVLIAILVIYLITR
ncbi:MAG TPA: hypothetical protein VN222_12770 [Novosphingobium sp.]|nr:hypothetical protein [Novosphingobium sp.]